jgi:hypothetical protein
MLQEWASFMKSASLDFDFRQIKLPKTFEHELLLDVKPVDKISCGGSYLIPVMGLVG